mmetsp:Transcript_80208/g.223355  ORF Transcript_80208/g.223355 Transcript_80208/m.223355 type:complete len:303 (-) Transcript_80208:163-1071(-)
MLAAHVPHLCRVNLQTPLGLVELRLQLAEFSLETLDLHPFRLGLGVAIARVHGLPLAQLGEGLLQKRDLSQRSILGLLQHELPALARVLTVLLRPVRLLPLLRNLGVEELPGGGGVMFDELQLFLQVVPGLQGGRSSGARLALNRRKERGLLVQGPLRRAQSVVGLLELVAERSRLVAGVCGALLGAGLVLGERGLRTPELVFNCELLRRECVLLLPQVREMSGPIAAGALELALHLATQALRKLTLGTPKSAIPLQRGTLRGRALDFKLLAHDFRGPLRRLLLEALDPNRDVGSLLLLGAT